MEWHKGTLLEALHNTVYSDKFGFHKIYVQSFEIYDEKIHDWRRPESLYLKQKDGCVNLNYSNEIKDINLLIERLFDLKFFALKSAKSNLYRGYYGVQRQVNKEDLDEVETSKILIKLRATYATNDRYGRRESHYDFSETYYHREGLKEKAYLISSQNDSLNIEPNLKDIKLGDKYYCKANNCSCEITKLYEYPNKDGLLFDIKLLSNETATDSDNFTVNEANKAEKQIFVLPYLERTKPSDCFNESLDEIHLQPYVTRDNNSKTYNVIWQPIDNAARYIVSLYKTVELSYKDKIYHLKDYEVDRTDNFISIDGLVGDHFVFVVKAEDRSGKEIARSRGIVLGEPKFW